MPNGKGRIVFCNGDCYEGDFINGEIEGEQNYYNYYNGHSYQGIIFKNLKEGYGVEKFPDSTVYKGLFYHGKKHGYGTIKYANGNEYIGDWKHDKMHGEFYFDYKNHNDNYYKGNFAYNKKEGFGIKKENGITIRGKWSCGNLLGEKSIIIHKY